MTRGTSGLQEIADGVFAFISPNGMSNAAFLVSQEGVVLLDARMTPSQAKELNDAIRRVTQAEVRWLVNTHFHGDHTFGNFVFAPKAQIISHPYTRERLAQLGPAYPQEFAKSRPELADEFRQVQMTLPDVTVTQQMSLFLDDRELQLFHPEKPAHTFGDLMGYLPREQVLFAGDVVFSGYHPVARDGHVSGWIDVLDSVQQMEIKTVVPGHGPVGDRAALQELREYLAELRRQVREKVEAGMPLEQVQREVRLERFAGWGSPERLAQCVQRVYDELKV